MQQEYPWIPSRLLFVVECFFLRSPASFGGKHGRGGLVKWISERYLSKIAGAGASDSRRSWGSCTQEHPWVPNQLLSFIGMYIVECLRTYQEPRRSFKCMPYAESNMHPPCTLPASHYKKRCLSLLVQPCLYNPVCTICSS